MSDEKLVRFSITVPENLLSEFEQSSNNGNRSESLRELMRSYISDQRWKNNGEICAVISICYDHHIPKLTRELTSAQHDFGDIIICSTHVHLSHETCLECVIAKGLSRDIQKFTESLKNIRGIKSLKFNILSEI